jgi:site-specific recombinase XerD
MKIEKLFESFVRAGKFLKNWSPKTERSYRQAFSSFQQSLAVLGENAPANTVVGKAQLEAWIVWMRQRGLSAGGGNVYIRGMNSFLSWLKEEAHIALPLRLKLLKLASRPLRGFSDAEIRTLLAFRPKSFFELRTWTLAQTLLDTGIRIEEALTLRTLQVNLEALTMTVVGKGDKTRTVPFSLELRKYCSDISRPKRSVKSMKSICFVREMAIGCRIETVIETWKNSVTL